MAAQGSRPAQVAYTLADFATGAVTAVAAAVPIHAVVHPGCDMVAAMLLGTLMGMGTHAVVLLVAGPLVGFFQVMAPGGLIGMYGGMFFAMRDSMQSASWLRVLLVAGLFGLAVVAAVRVYDRALRSSSALDEGIA